MAPLMLLSTDQFQTTSEEPAFTRVAGRWTKDVASCAHESVDIPVHSCHICDMSADHSSASATLRDRQLAATREEIVTTAMRLLERGDENVSHEAIAREAGMSTRTVYRHFEDRTVLMHAVWWKLRQMLNIRFPATEEEIIPLGREAFRSLEEHGDLVRTVMSYVGWTLARNQQGLAPMMQGSDSFSHSLGPVLAGASPKKRKLIVGSFAAMYSAPFWHLLRDRGGLSGAEAEDAIEWMMTVLLAAIHTQPTQSKKEKKK